MKEISAHAASDRPAKAGYALSQDNPDHALRAALGALISGKDIEQNMRTLKQRLGDATGRGTSDVLGALVNSVQGTEIPRETLEKMLTLLPPKRSEKAAFIGSSGFVFSASPTLSGAKAFVNY